MTTGRILLLLAALAALMAGARASPLDAESCARLLSEHGELEGAGVEADMAKGPEWARANLGLEKLERIRRFIEVTEQLVFRCRQKSLVSLPSENEDQKIQDKDDGKADAPRVPAAGTTDKAKGSGKAKAPPAAARKKTAEPARKAALQPARKAASMPKAQPKRAPGAAKPPQKKAAAQAKAPAKQPAGKKGERAPSKAAAGKGAAKTADDDD
jgi:hypothetical protein